MFSSQTTHEQLFTVMGNKVKDTSVCKLTNLYFVCKKPAEVGVYSVIILTILNKQIASLHSFM